MTFRGRFFITALVAAVLVVVGLQFATGQGMGSTTSEVSNLAAVGSAFDDTLQYVIAGGYILMFVGMVVEGPLVTAAASFAAALGYVNIFAVFALSIFADLSADIGYYVVGYVSRVAVIERYGHRFGITTARMKHMERLLKTHPKKTIVVLKLIPGLALPGLMMVGATRLRVTTFMTICLALILPIEGTFMFLGYHFGRSYDSISQYVHNGAYVIVGAIVALLIIYYAYKKLTATFARRLETI